MSKPKRKYPEGLKPNGPELSAEDIIHLYGGELLTFAEARYNLGFAWFGKDEQVYSSIKQVEEDNKGKATK